jgi:predicted ATP-dependent endonuclease of OLD family
MGKKEDLSVDGPGSPISIKKFNDTRSKKDDKTFTVLIENEGLGFSHDDPEFIYITPNDCSEQAIYFLKNGFDPEKLPAYLYRYLSLMYQLEKQFETNQEYNDAIANGSFGKEDNDYKEVMNKVKYCESNHEAKQIIGLCQLFGGTLNQAKKAKVNVKIFIQEPETYLHPKRERMIMSLFQLIQKEYKT